MRRESALVIANDALIWLAADPDLMGVFLGSSGIDPADLRRAAGDPDLLAAVLDFLLLDDAWILGFAQSASLPPDRVAAARAALPGGADVHWT